MKQLSLDPSAVFLVVGPHRRLDVAHYSGPVLCYIGKASMHVLNSVPPRPDSLHDYTRMYTACIIAWTKHSKRTIRPDEL
jgi:hypothetical protein